MTITKNLVELMNGHILVESTHGKGSTFSVSLPTCQATSSKTGESLGALKTPLQNSPDNIITVLHIEDNPANMLLVQDILSEYHEINLLTAQQAEIGLDLAYAHQPNLILLDINLPDIDGFETLKRLQNLEETHDIPVVAISANAMEKDIRRALEAGFKNYLTKPLDISKFKTMLNEFVS